MYTSERNDRFRQGARNRLNMFATVPLLCFISIVFYFRLRTNECDPLAGWRISFISASVVWGALLLLITEVLSIFNAISFGWLLGTWTTVTLVFAFACVRLIRREKTPISLKVTPIRYSESILLTGVGLIVVTVGIIALVAPPNTWDSMTYHMSRIAHWIQNRSVAHYPTHTLTQLHMAPWTEFAILNIQALTGGDRFANLVQWFSMVGCVVGVSFIAKQLGANARGQILAAVVCAAIPMGILQGSSTKNDYVLSFWLVCCACYIILLKQRQSVSYALAAGVSLGLALLTKETGYIFAFPLLLWCGISILGKLRRKSWKPALIIAAVALSINLGHYARNVDLYRNPLGPFQETGGYTYTNEAFTVPLVVSNLIRNISVHINTPSERINDSLEGLIRRLHWYLGVDANDQRTTFKETTFGMYGLTTHESDAGNPVHIALIAMSIVLFFASKQRGRPRDLLSYGTAIMGGFLLFCIYLKWQPYHGRLHLPLLVLWSPFIGAVFTGITNQKISLLVGIAALLLALPALLLNESRPVIGVNNIFKTNRIDQYFSNNVRMKESYVNAAQLVKSTGCSDIGLVMYPLVYEYPLWVLLRESNDSVRIEHVNVTNLSARKLKDHPHGDFVPCVVIYISREDVMVVAKRQKDNPHEPSTSDNGKE